MTEHFFDVLLDRDGNANHVVDFTDGRFVDVATGRSFDSLRVGEEVEAGEEWQRLQDEALEEYERTHVLDEQPQTMKLLYRLFEWYVSSRLPVGEQTPAVLDIGCGIGTGRPRYAEFIGREVSYVGLDALAVNLQREYPFVCSRIEHFCDLPAFQDRFDAVIFGTSLDHFEDQEEVVASVHKLAKPGAIGLFWIGVHDPEVVASGEGAELFDQMFAVSTRSSFLMRYLKFSFWTFPRIALSIFRNQQRLDLGESLDKFHCWYFRTWELPKILARYGEILDITRIPGSNSIFCACRLFKNADD